jgi:hypothetical protein
MPNKASDLLPWFMNGTLPPEEEAAVAKQLRVSPEMRKELADLQKVADVVRENRPSDWQPSAGHLAGIMDRIDAETPKRVDQGDKAPRVGLLEAFRNLGRGMRWVFAAQLAVILILAGVLLTGQKQAPEDSTYQTLTSSHGIAIQKRSIKVVFAPDATAEQMQTLLSSIDAKIIGGPSALGSFTIAIPDDMMIETARNALRESPIVLLVQIQQITTRD